MERECSLKLTAIKNDAIKLSIADRFGWTKSFHLSRHTFDGDDTQRMSRVEDEDKLYADRLSSLINAQISRENES